MGQSLQVADNAGGAFVEQNGEENTGSEVRTRECRMALVFIVQHRMDVVADELLPRDSDRNDGCAEFFADSFVGTRDCLLRLRRVLAGPRQIQRGLRSRGFDRLIEESDVLVHAERILERQCALLLQYHVIVACLLDCLLGSPLFQCIRSDAPPAEINR